MSEYSLDGKNLTRRQAVAAFGAGVVVTGSAAALAGTQVAGWAKADAEKQIQELQSLIGQMQEESQALRAQYDESQKRTEMVLAQKDQVQEQKDALQQQKDAIQQQNEALQRELLVLKGLAALYETLDKVGIDAVIGSAIAGYRGTLNTLEAGVD